MKFGAKFCLLMISVMTLALLGGCETFKGTGRDIANFGKLISGD